MRVTGLIAVVLCAVPVLAQDAAVSLANGTVKFLAEEVRKPRYSSAESRSEAVAAGVTRVEWRFTPTMPQGGGHLAVRLRFLLERPAAWEAARRDFHWIPNIKTRPEQVASDHVFRSPAAILMSGSTGVALIPDLDALRRSRPVSQYLDMGFPEGKAPYIDFGFAATEPEGHTYYKLGSRWSPWEFDRPGVAVGLCDGGGEYQPGRLSGAGVGVPVVEVGPPANDGCGAADRAVRHNRGIRL